MPQCEKRNVEGMRTGKVVFSCEKLQEMFFRCIGHAMRCVGMGYPGTNADQGPGIPPAERENLFRSFVRLDQGDEQHGIGLGLYVVKTVVEAHGGRVGVDDRPGGGSLFWFEIPVPQKVSA